MSKKITIRELKQDELKHIIPLIIALNPGAVKSEIESMLPKMQAEGYRCVGAWLEDKLVGASGFWIGHRFWCDKFIEPDNVVVLPEARGLGAGKKMMDWIEAEGKRIGCSIIKLEAYATNTPAHKFYLSSDYIMPGKVFVRALGRSNSEWLDKLDSKRLHS